MMKFIAFIAALFLTSTAAFAPAPSNQRTSVARYALADEIFGMDLFAPKKDQNFYGARSKKNLKRGQITESSYVPAGLTKEQYQKVREAEEAKKAAKYQKNVAKAGKFLGFDKFYEMRGTTEGGNWLTAPGRGHTFAKTKFDWSGTADAKKFESTKIDTPVSKKAPAAKKLPAKSASSAKPKFSIF